MVGIIKIKLIQRFPSPSFQILIKRKKVFRFQPEYQKIDTDLEHQEQEKSLGSLRMAKEFRIKGFHIYYLLIYLSRVYIVIIYILIWYSIESSIAMDSE